MVLFEYAGISNGTLDGTLSWYSVNSYGRASPSPAAVFDPYTQPYPTPSVFPNGSKYLRDPAGWGYLLYPPPPSQRTKASWAPVESVSCCPIVMPAPACFVHDMRPTTMTVLESHS